MHDLKARDNKKLKGDLFEEFCQLYLQAGGKYKTVWLWKEVPETIKKEMNLPLDKQDNGIDLIAVDHRGRYSAIQCKYRHKVHSTVPWTTLSTFVGMCSLSNAWVKKIVMTNCRGVSRKLPLTPKDSSICHGTFRGTKRLHWMKMAGTYVENVLAETDGEIPRTLTPEEVREKRLLHLSKISRVTLETTRPTEIEKPKSQSLQLPGIYSTEVPSRLYEALKTRPLTCLCYPTGTGKTVCALETLARIVADQASPPTGGAGPQVIAWALMPYRVSVKEMYHYVRKLFPHHRFGYAMRGEQRTAADDQVRLMTVGYGLETLLAKYRTEGFKKSESMLVLVDEAHDDKWQTDLALRFLLWLQRPEGAGTRPGERGGGYPIRLWWPRRPSMSPRPLVEHQPQ